MSADNGILAAIPGQFVSAASAQLPDPSKSPRGAIANTEIEVPGFGRVRFTAVRMESSRAKSSSHFWSVSKAVRVDAPRALLYGGKRYPLEAAPGGWQLVVPVSSTVNDYLRMAHTTASPVDADGGSLRIVDRERVDDDQVRYTFEAVSAT